MNSNKVKAALLAYFRYKKQVHYMATECGFFSSDLLMESKGLLTEIEVKVSLADFRADFKKPKHEFYIRNVPNKYMMTSVYAQTGDGRRVLDEHNRYIKIGEKVKDIYKWSKPNFFIFAVPESLVEKVHPYLEEHYPMYGLIAVADAPDSRFNKVPQDYVRVVKRPKRLHNEQAHPTIKETIVARMSSEIARLRIGNLGKDDGNIKYQEDGFKSKEDDEGSESWS